MLKYDIVYYCDSYADIGNGHLARGLTILNNLLKVKDLRCAVSGNISKNGLVYYHNHPISKEIDIYSSRKYIDSKIAVIDTMFIPGDADYIDESVSEKIKSKSDILIAISSGFYPQINKHIDVLFDHIPDAKPTGDTSKTKIYKGFKFIPVSDDDLDISISKTDMKSQKVLCIIGGNENSFGIKDFIKKIGNKLHRYYNIDIVLSPHYSEELIIDLKDMYSEYNISFFQNLHSLNKLFEEASVLITTYGNSTYESLKLNKICFTIAFRKFQYDYGQYLEKKGLSINLGYIDNIDESRLNVLHENDKIRQLKSNTQKHFNNAGLHNISDYISEKI